MIDAGDLELRRGALSAAKRALLASRLRSGASAGGPADATPRPTIVPAPADRFEPFPLTDLQHAYWVGRSDAFGLGQVGAHSYVEFDGPALDVERLERAFNRLVDRHDMLRAVVRDDGRQQVPASVPAYRIAAIDLRDATPRDVEEHLRTVRAEMSHRVFDPARWPLFDVRVTRLPGRRMRLHIGFDVLFVDGSSVQILFRELWMLYEHPDARLPSLDVSFRDYVLASLRLRDTEPYRRHEAYWTRRLETLPAGPSLPLSRAPHELAAPEFVRRSGRLDARAWARLKARAAAAGHTPSAVVLTAFAEVIAAWSDTPRFVVNLTLYNRLPLHPQVPRIVGDFTSVTLLEVDAESNDALDARMRRVQTQLWTDLEHPLFGGIQVLRERARRLRRRVGAATMPVVFTSLLGQPVATDGAALPLGLKVAHAISQTPQVSIDNQVMEVDDTLAYQWDLASVLFCDGVPDAMFEAFEALLARMASDDDVWGARTCVTPAAALAQQARRNDTAARVPAGLLHEPFVHRAQARPEALAVIAPDRVLTYAELDARSARVAQRLVSEGVRPNTLVAVVMEKGWEQIVAVLGILRAGAAYVPIDASLPEERLWHLLGRAEASIALTQDRIERTLGWPPGVRRHVVEDAPPPLPCALPTPRTTPEDIAYVIFTSGSTGLPKGVVIDHRGALNTIVDINTRFRIRADDRVLALSALSFDLSVYDIFGVLAVGGALVLPDADGGRDPAHWLALMHRHAVTLWNTVPALMQMLVTYARSVQPPSVPLREVLLSGDWIPLRLPDEIRATFPGAAVSSLGGATEASIWSVIYPIGDVQPDWRSIPYGYPLTNQRTYVLDARLAPRPTWVPGDLYIGGIGVARGYWRDAERTAASFIVHPETGERLYRTGDLARYHPDGTLEFLGRRDFQVKVRGHRIELGEIEHALLGHDAVRDAVVVVVGDGDARRLVAYVVGDDVAEPALRSFLHTKLPAYMVPSAFVALDAFPLSANGKVDRAALPAPAASPRRDAGRSTGAADPIEEAVALAVAAILGADDVGPEDEFFELGGNSLDATRLIVRLRELFGVEVSLRRLFEAASVRSIAALVRAARREGTPDGPELSPVQRTTPPPLSFGQERLWALQRLMPGFAAYNTVDAVRLAGTLDATVLERCVNAVVARHEVLRTTFAPMDGRPCQLVADAMPVALAVVDIGDAPAHRVLSTLVGHEAAHPYDLATGPLIRVHLLRLRRDAHVLVVGMHHAVCDAWSIAILVREVSALYAAAIAGVAPRLEPLPVQYADFAVWQRRLAETETFARSLDVWKERLADVPTALALATDRPRPAQPSYRGARHDVTLPADIVDGLRALGRGEGATLFMALLACFAILLARHSGQTDLVVGTPIANRRHPRAEPLIGFFVNTLPLRLDVRGEPTFRELLRRVREVAVDAYVHQDVPFEKLVEAVRPRRAANVHPLFQVMFALQNAPVATASLPGVAVEPLRLALGAAKFDLVLELIETADGISGFFEYSTDLFEGSTVAGLARQFLHLASAAARTPDVAVTALPLVSRAESVRLVDAARGPIVPREPCLLHALVQDQVRRTPAAICLVDGSISLTYAELDARANAVAHRLHAHGITPDRAVAVVAERSAELVVTALGILKAGAAYLPIDPALPTERCAAMLREADAQLVLAAAPLASGLAVVPVLPLGTAHERSSTPPGVTVDPENLAYVLTTSGSTGVPKAVGIAHRAISHRVLWGRDAGHVRHGDRVLVHTALGFDVSICEIFEGLAAGATLVIAPPREIVAGATLGALIARHGITVLNAAPSVLQTLVDEPALATCRTLRAIYCGAEPLSPALRDTILTRFPVDLVNLYGLTEATVDSAAWRCAPADDAPDVPIGRPLPNVALCLLDERMVPIPDGAPGEIYVGGAGLARGYLGQSALTAASFVPDPFVETPGARLFRTGDFGRRRVDGAVVFLGRQDRRVKVRGVRVELGEVEAALRRHPDVQDAVVLPSDGEAHSRLLAYVVPRPGRAVTAPALHRHARASLPRALRPSGIEVRDAIPRTASGKLDVAALQRAAGRVALDADVAPRDAYEVELAALWEELLGVGAIGIRDDFFERGGHSLLAAQLGAIIERRYGRTLPLARFVEAPTVEDLAEWLRGDAAAEASILLPFRARASKTPLFLVHAAGGNVVCYRDLARLVTTAHPVYGVRHVPHDGGSASRSDVAAMARAYATAIRDATSEPPVLAGWSMGGVLAFETARQLDAHGLAVRAVVLVDARPGDGLVPTDDTLLAEFRARLGVRDGMTLHEVCEAAVTQGTVPAGVPPETLARWFDVYAAHARALARYRPSIGVARLVLVVPENLETAERERMTAAWSVAARGTLTVRTVPGDHGTVLTPPNVSAVAAIVNAELALG
jgi:amino acid adenylation domain-containing protein